MSFGPFKPKAKEYKAGPEEQMQAAVGLADYRRQAEIYDPVNKEFMKQAGKDYATTYRGRGAADASQTLTPDLGSYQNVIGRGGTGFDTGGDYGSALLGQGTEASKAALAVTAALESDALNSIINKQGTTTSAISQSAQIEQSKALSRARDKQKVRDAYASALGSIAGAGFSQGMQNRQDTGKFFTAGGTGDFSGQRRYDPANMISNPTADYEYSGFSRFTGKGSPLSRRYKSR